MYVCLIFAGKVLIEKKGWHSSYISLRLLEHNRFRSTRTKKCSVKWKKTIETSSLYISGTWHFWASISTTENEFYLLTLLCVPSCKHRFLWNEQWATLEKWQTKWGDLKNDDNKEQNSLLQFWGKLKNCVRCGATKK